MAASKDNITLLPYRERVKLVRDRLARLRRPIAGDLPKSARVLAAEKIVDEYRDRNQKHRDQQYSAYLRRRNEVEDALIVGDTAKAVELLRKMEAA